MSGLPAERLNEIMQRMPVDVAEVILSAVRSLCSRLNLTTEETTDFVKKVEGGNMGYLWENMEKMDIQLERRNTAEQRQRAEEAERRLEEAEQKAEEAEQKAEEAEKKKHELYLLLITAYRKQGMDQETIAGRLMAETGLDRETVSRLLESDSM